MYSARAIYQLLLVILNQSIVLGRFIKLNYLSVWLLGHFFSFSLSRALFFLLFVVQRKGQ